MSDDKFFPQELLTGDVGNLDSEVLAQAASYRPVTERSELDRWILSELAITVETITERMDAYDNYGACQSITRFVDVLSNWYVRRSRERFWSKDYDSPEKRDAYWTLFECLVTTTKLVAPFVPFVAETIWQNLAGSFETATSSVHLCDYPVCNNDWKNETLSNQMNLMREIASLGLSARMQEKLKVRQPLSGVTVALNEATHQPWLTEQIELLKRELNVKEITFTTDAAEFVNYKVLPNFKQLGAKLGKLMPVVKKSLDAADGEALLEELSSTGKIVLTVADSTVELDKEDIEIRLSAKEGWTAAQGAGCVVVLATELTPELIAEGKARDVVRYVNDYRKKRELDPSDDIDLVLNTTDEELQSALQLHQQYILDETKSVSLSFEPTDDELAEENQVGDSAIKMFLTVATKNPSQS